MSKKKLPERVYLPHLKKDLSKKMVFICGPRQVGKTTLSLELLSQVQDSPAAYLNWDNELDRQLINKQEWSKSEKVIVFDEIHKKRGWQTFIKGAWDKWKGVQNYILTGSARLDVFRKGGDSMLGRYHDYRIHPFTLNELGNNFSNQETLFKFGGFPEPLVERNETELRRWHLQRVSKLVRLDLRDLENIANLDKVEILADDLPTRVSSLLSYKNLSEDLLVSDKTIKNWVLILEKLYYCYLVWPYGASKMKAVKKMPKLYLWDWSQIQDPSARFENMVASHLLKTCHYWEDVLGYKTDLRFIRDASSKECDFVVFKDKKPMFAVECKLNDAKVSESLIYLRNKIQIPHWYQVTYNEKTRRVEPDLTVLSFSEFCKVLDLV